MDKINPQEQTRDTSVSKKSPTKDFIRQTHAPEQQLPQNRPEAAQGSTSSPKDLTINPTDRHTSGHHNRRLQARESSLRQQWSGDYGTPHSRQSQSKQVWRPKLSDQGTSSSSERPLDADQKKPPLKGGGGGVYGIFGSAANITNTGSGAIVYKSRGVRISGVDDSSEQQKKK